MPVPVPLNNKPVAHPVAKNFNPRSASHPYTSDLQHLARSLPVSPAGPPPSFGTREQWINSLPSWRRSKPRRIWEEDTHTVPGHRQYFHQGLTAAEDAVVIKGKRAQACIPPLGTLLQSLGVPSQPKAKMPALTFGTMNDYDQYSMSVDAVNSSGTVRGTSDCAGSTRSGSYGGSPMLRDESPTGTDNDGSSPLGPVTPFSDFIDRAVSTPAVTYQQDDRSMGRVIQDPYYAAVDYMPGGALPPPFRPPVEYVKEQVPAPVAAPEVVTPSASPGYRKLAEPLADWVVNYVWRVCTTGFSLPPKFAVSRYVFYSVWFRRDINVDIDIILAVLHQPNTLRHHLRISQEPFTRSSCRRSSSHQPCFWPYGTSSTFRSTLMLLVSIRMVAESLYLGRYC